MEIPKKHPQEIEYWYVLPAIRKELVIALKEKGINQKEIAGLLNLTAPAVSQYMQDKRAKDITLPADVKVFIREAALGIIDKESAYHNIQRISSHIKTTKALCRIHMDVESGLDNCDICYV
jgi:predicted transcriptional regulator